MHGDDEKFFLACWCTGLASENLIVLVKMYGEDILETVKGCQFHIRDLVNIYTRLIKVQNAIVDIVRLSFVLAFFA